VRSFRSPVTLLSAVRYRPTPFHALSLLLGALIATAGCQDTTEPDAVFSMGVAPTRATIAIGGAQTFQTFALYESGRTETLVTGWRVSDPGVLELWVDEDGRAIVVGLEAGEGHVIALIDDRRVDSASVAVAAVGAIRPGAIRWRLAGYGDETSSGAALDARGTIYTVQAVSGMRLTAVTPEGAIVYSRPGCWAVMAGSVLPDGTAYTMGLDCVRRHGPDGATHWRLDHGATHGGLAVARDGSVAVIGGVGLVLISPDGTERWRAPGPVIARHYRSAPIIAGNGDVYVAWGHALRFWLAQYSREGEIIGAVTLPGEVNGAVPALDGTRVVLTHLDGRVTVVEAGAVLWERDWTTEGRISSAAIDGDGNIYIQSRDLLVSYGADGTLRWSADSLSLRNYDSEIPTPTLLSDNRLLTACRDGASTDPVELCLVDAADGSLVWRTALGGQITGSPAVAPDGTIYVSSGTDLLALWGDAPPLTEGWPTEGGGMGRLRRGR
jgi:hypothetical protein